MVNEDIYHAHRRTTFTNTIFMLNSPYIHNVSNNKTHTAFMVSFYFLMALDTFVVMSYYY